MKNVTVLGSFLQNVSITASVIFGLLLGSYYYFGGFYDDGSKLEAKIAETQALIQQAELKKKETTKLLAEEGELKKDVGELAEKFKEVSSKLPNNLRTQEIIDTVNQLAKNAGCKVVLIKPGPVVTKELYDEIPIQVEMRGAFSNLVVFMYYLATLERVTYTSDVSFSNFGPAYDGNLKFATSVVSFRFRQPAEQKNEDGKPKEVKPPQQNKAGGDV
jgi:type IV pilus assembly protein PilO